MDWMPVLRLTVHAQYLMGGLLGLVLVLVYLWRSKVLVECLPKVSDEAFLACFDEAVPSEVFRARGHISGLLRIPEDRLYPGYKIADLAYKVEPNDVFGTLLSDWMEEISEDAEGHGRPAPSSVETIHELVVDLMKAGQEREP